MAPEIEEAVKQDLKDLEETKSKLEKRLGNDLLGLIIEAEHSNVPLEGARWTVILSIK